MVQCVKKRFFFDMRQGAPNRYSWASLKNENDVFAGADSS